MDLPICPAVNDRLSPSLPTYPNLYSIYTVHFIFPIKKFWCLQKAGKNEQVITYFGCKGKLWEIIVLVLIFQGGLTSSFNWTIFCSGWARNFHICPSSEILTVTSILFHQEIELNKGELRVKVQVERWCTGLWSMLLTVSRGTWQAQCGLWRPRSSPQSMSNGQCPSTERPRG